jgi:hypothetical protein
MKTPEILPSGVNILWRTNGEDQQDLNAFSTSRESASDHNI